jgi:hypothetical protein
MIEKYNRIAESRVIFSLKLEKEKRNSRIKY